MSKKRITEEMLDNYQLTEPDIGDTVVYYNPGHTNHLYQGKVIDVYDKDKDEDGVYEDDNDYYVYDYIDNFPYIINFEKELCSGIVDILHSKWLTKVIKRNHGMQAKLLSVTSLYDSKYTILLLSDYNKIMGIEDNTLIFDGLDEKLEEKSEGEVNDMIVLDEIKDFNKKNLIEAKKQADEEKVNAEVEYAKHKYTCLINEKEKIEREIRNHNKRLSEIKEELKLFSNSK